MPLTVSSMTIQLGYALAAPLGTYVEHSPTPCRPEPIVIGEPLDAPPRFELTIMDPPHCPSYTDDNKNAPLAMMI